MATVSQDGNLTTAIWSNSEMDDISWHDSQIRAMLLDRSQLLLDIDFICEWIMPETRGDLFSFYIAPATLVFPYAEKVHISLEWTAPMSIFDIHGQNSIPTPQGQEFISEWSIAGPHGHLDLRSSGYVLYFRREPLLTQQQYLTLQQRGGISFEIPGGYGN